MKYLQIVKGDVYDIAKRVKSINKNYNIFFNSKSKKYELHSMDRTSSTFELTIPSNKLDCRALKLIAKNIRVNKIDLFKEIENHNIKIENEIKEKRNDISAYKLNEIFSYADSGKEYNFNEGYKNKWI